MRAFGKHGVAGEPKHQGAGIVRERLPDIDRAKGLAITLVVLGHLAFDTVPAGNEWYEHLNVTLYKFHIAFFMFISGFVMFYTYPELHTWSQYGAYVKKRALRLVPAYLLFAAVLLVGKLALSRVGHLENPVDGLADVAKAFLCPYRSYCRYLWYVYVLFLYYLTIPLLLKLFREDWRPLLLFALILYFLPRSYYLAEKQAAEYLLVFLLGGYAFRHQRVYLSLLDRYCWLFVLAFAGLVLLNFAVDIPPLLFAFVAIPALHSLVRLRGSERLHLLQVFGRYTFPVYLFNTAVIGTLMLVLQRYWPLEGRAFCVAAPFLFLSGLLVPIAVYELLIRRTPILNRIIQA